MHEGAFADWLGGDQVQLIGPPHHRLTCLPPGHALVPLGQHDPTQHRSSLGAVPALLAEPQRHRRPRRSRRSLEARHRRS